MKINDLIDEINSLIRQNLFNMVTLLHASPTNRELPSLGPHMPKDQIKIPNFLRSDLLETLGERNKVLNMKFGILTEETLRSALDTGSRILYLGSDVAHPEGIVLERAKGGCELFTYRDLQRLFTGSKVKRFQAAGDGGGLTGGSGIELAIVGTKNDEKFANFLAQDLDIKHVIYFRFHREKFQDHYREQWYEDVYVTKFIQFFLNELVTGKSVEESFDFAHQDAINCISDSFFHGNLQKATEYMAPGAILLPDSSELNLHHEKLFEFGNYILPDGKPEDISTRRPPSNVRKTFLPFFGRANEMDVVIEQLFSKSSSNNQFIKIQGASGVGKTRFVLELAYRLLQRCCFKDGIFYIPLRRLKSMTFFELLENTLSSRGLGQKIGTNLQSIFRNKEMLLIFDDFDMLYTEHIEFPPVIFPALKRSKVKVIITCTKWELKGKIIPTKKESWERFKEKQKAKENEYVGKTHDLNPLENEHLAHLVVSLTDPNIDGVSEQDALNHSKLAQIRGIPMDLIQALNQNKLVFKDKLLEINPYLKQYLDLDKRYGQIIKFGRDLINRENAPNISRLSSNFSTYLKQLSQNDKMIANLMPPSIDDAGQFRFSFVFNEGASRRNSAINQDIPLAEEVKEVKEEDNKSEIKEADNESETSEVDNDSHLLGIPTESSDISSSRESIEIEEKNAEESEK